MPNPTTKVQSAGTRFDDQCRYWPLSSGNLPYTYVNGQMMGIEADGYATNMDDSAPLRFEGLWTGISLLIDSLTQYPRSRSDVPRTIIMPLHSGTASRATDLGKPVYAYDAGSVTLDPSGLTYANLVGFVVDVSPSVPPSPAGANVDALTGPGIEFIPVTRGDAGATKITPSALAGAVNNYAPTGLDLLAPGGTLRQDPGGAARDLTGLAAGRPNQIIRLVNLGATAGYNLVLQHQNAGSLAANRFLNPGLQDFIVPAAGVVTLIYDKVATAWRPIGDGGAAADVTAITDNSGGTANVATGVDANGPKSTIILPVQLTDLANAETYKVAVPFAFLLAAISFRTGNPATTAAKAATLTAQIAGTPVTGGVVSLTSADQNTTGVATAGTAITALNIGTAGQTVEVAVSAVTAFVEGDGWVEFTLVNLDLANAEATLAGQLNALITAMKNAGLMN